MEHHIRSVSKQRQNNNDHRSHYALNAIISIQIRSCAPSGAFPNLSQSSISSRFGFSVRCGFVNVNLVLLIIYRLSCGSYCVFVQQIQFMIFLISGK